MKWLAASVAVTLVLSPVADTRLAAQPENLPHVVSTSERVIEGRRVVERDEFSGLRVRETRCVERVCTGRWFDGRRAYAVDVNETAVPLDAEVSALEVSVEAVTTGAYLTPAFGPAGGRVEPAGPSRLRVRAPEGRPVFVTLDPGTHRASRIEDEDGDEDVSLTDYRRVGPLVLPFRIVGPGSILQYDSRAIAPGTVAPPPGLAVRIAPSPPASFSGRLPIVPCTLAGQPLHCLLDTGSSGLSLALRQAERLHLEPYGETAIAAMSRFETAFVETGPLLVGGATVERARFSLIPDPPRGVDAVLGTDLFAAAAVVVDYPHSRVTIAAPQTLPASPAMAAGYRALRAELPVTIDGLTTRLVVDTGDVSGVDVSYAFYRKHTGTLTVTGRGNAAGVGGTSDVLTGHIRELILGDHHVRDVPLWVTRSLEEERGRIGAALLARFVVSFDLAHDRIAFQSPR